MHILQVTPAIYARGSLIGGSEKSVIYTDLALRRAAAADGMELTTSVLSFGVDPSDAMSDNDVRYRVIAGSPWEATTIDANDLIAELRRADAVYVTQCLHTVGMFVAAHARLLGRRVIGKDAGAGEDPRLIANPDLARVYDGFHAQSHFARSCFTEFNVPVHQFPGPIDTEVYRPSATPRRDRRVIVAVGRLLPHKGFDRIIKALPPDLSLVIAGQPDQVEYVTYLNNLARGKNVTITSGLDDAALRTLLQTAGLFVHASTHFDARGSFHYKPELLGLAPLEALSCGLPVLVSDAGALPELAHLPGCECFQYDDTLAAMLRSHAAGTTAYPSEQAMHAAVAARHGASIVGRQLINILLGPD